MSNRFGISLGNKLNDGQERVFFNTMVIDVLGNIAAFADLNPLDMAVIQSELGSDGVLLAISETSQQDAIRDEHRVELAFSPRFKSATDEQREVLAVLAENEIDDDKPLPSDLADTSRRLLPSLWYSEVAFMPDGLLFRKGLRHSQYTSAIAHINRTIRDEHTQAHREHNVGLRAHLDAQGIDMSAVSKPELSEQRRQREIDEVDQEFSKALARAQELQLYSTDLTTPQFVVAVAKAHLAKSAR